MAEKSFILPRLLPRDQVICRIVDSIEDLPISEGFRVELHRHKSTRSDKQNNTLWWIYDEILKRGGETMGGWIREDLHEFFLIEHFGAEVHTVFGKKRQRPIRRSSRLSKLEFAEFVEFIYRFMAQQGIVLPDPDPDYAIHRAEAAAA
jgi:hypothetical protein